MPPETTPVIEPISIPPDIEMSTAKKSFPVFPVISILLLIIIIFGSYFLYTNIQPKTNLETISESAPTQTPSPTIIPEISTSTDPSIIKKELENTTLNSMDPDFAELDASADQL